MTEWISVNKRLPEEDQKVLAATYHKIYIAYRRKEEEYNEHWTICEDVDCSCTGCTAPILYWMPLPSLPVIIKDPCIEKMNEILIEKYKLALEMIKKGEI